MPRVVGYDVFFGPLIGGPNLAFLESVMQIIPAPNEGV
jgi:hypothetical protein